jgi:hypothetical protein
MFSISDAKNEAGEWVMSPEQIRAEMNVEPEYCGACGGRGHTEWDCDYDPYDDEPDPDDPHDHFENASMDREGVWHCDQCDTELLGFYPRPEDVTRFIFWDTP